MMNVLKGLHSSSFHVVLTTSALPMPVFSHKSHHTHLSKHTCETQMMHEMQRYKS